MDVVSGALGLGLARCDSGSRCHRRAADGHDPVGIPAGAVRDIQLGTGSGVDTRAVALSDGHGAGQEPDAARSLRHGEEAETASHGVGGSVS